MRRVAEIVGDAENPLERGLAEPFGIVDAKDTAVFETPAALATSAIVTRDTLADPDRRRPQPAVKKQVWRGAGHPARRARSVEHSAG